MPSTKHESKERILKKRMYLVIPYHNIILSLIIIILLHHIIIITPIVDAFSVNRIFPRQVRSSIPSLQEAGDNIISSDELEIISSHSFNKHISPKKKAPIFITIGPPCSGKTDALRTCLLSDGYDPDDIFTKDVDISLTSQSKAYHKIPIAGFLFPSTHLKEEIANQTLSSGCTVKERLFDPSYDATDQEIRNIILRIAGRLTPQDFAMKSEQQALEAGDTIKFFKKRRMAVAKDLINAIEMVHLQAVSEVICSVHFQIPTSTLDSKEGEEIPYDEEEDAQEYDSVGAVQDDASNISMANITQVELLSARDLIKTPFVEIFIPQAIFRDGISNAKKKLESLLEKVPDEQPISWGNTNTRPNEYTKALKLAEKSGRPVKFIAWGDRLPEVAREELFRRNIANLRNKGRYIPVGAIAASLGRVEKLMSDAALELENMVDGKGNQDGERSSTMDAALARLAGFDMMEGGYVVQANEPRD